MRFFARSRLLWRFALAAAVVFVVLGLVLGRLLVDQTKSTILADKSSNVTNFLAPEVSSHLAPQDLQGAMTPDRLAALDQWVRSTVLSAHVIEITVWDLDGNAAYSTDRSVIGTVPPMDPGQVAAAKGVSSADLVHPTPSSHTDELLLGDHFEIYVPIDFGQAASPAGVLEVHETSKDLVAEITAEQRSIDLCVAGGMGVLYLILVAIVYATHRTLARSEKRFRTLFTSDPQALVVHDLVGRILEANDAACQQYGYTRDALSGMEIFELFARSERPKFLDYLARRDPALASDGGEWLHKRSDGGEFWIHGRAQAIDFAGRPARLALLEDVTAHKKAQAEVDRLVSILDATTDFVATADGAGNLLYLNRAGRRILGIGDDAALAGKTIADCHPLWASQVVLWEGIPAAQERGAWSGETALIGPHGQEIPVSQVILAHHVEGDEHVYLSTVMRDIREQKAAEDLLRRREEEFRLLFTANPEPMWLFDHESLQFVEVNDAALRLYGYSREEFLAMSVLDVRPADDQERLRQAVTGWMSEHADQGEWIHVRKDGSRIWVHIYAHLMEFEGRQRMLVVASDVTERRRVEAQLVQVQKMEAIGRLAGGVAHDFNNLLTAIIGYCHLAAAELDEGSTGREDIEEAMRVSQRAAALTRQLLAFARRGVVQPKDVDLNELLRGMDRMLRPLIGEDVDLVLKTDQAPLVSYIDPGHFEQLVVNLAVNARDAMPAGGQLVLESRAVEIEPAQAVADLPPGPYALVAVTDDGTGMPPETVEHIFEPFFTTKEQGKGTGLGLATCFGIVKQARGNITVYSEVGHGTTFKIYLPLAPGAQVTTVQPAETAASESPADRETGVILLVEDQQQVRQLTERLLRSEGFEVIAAASPAAALQLAGEAPRIDLILSDVVMPGMDGMTMVERLTAMIGHRPALFMSGYSEESVLLKCAARPDTSFVSKPVSGSALVAKARELLSAAHSKHGPSREGETPLAASTAGGTPRE